MSNCPLCNLDAATSEAAPDPVGSQPAGPRPRWSKSGERKRPAGLIGRAWRSIQWLFPATLLVLMPKCPLCVAAYVAFFTGVGVSVSTARWIRILMLVFCLTSLAYLAIRSWRRRAKSRECAVSSGS